MDGLDDSITAFYRLAIGGDWRRLRREGLAGLVCACGAEGAAWWSHAIGQASEGLLTQSPESCLLPETVRALASAEPDRPFPAAASDGAPLCALVHRHRGNGLESLLVVRAGVQVAAVFQRLARHLVEAGDLALEQFVQRDDLLRQLGRAHRGGAGLIAADGTLFAASQQLQELFGRLETARLPLCVPEALRRDGGEFVHGELHVRVVPQGPLYLLNVRRPLPLDQLSAREQEIARQLARGKTLKSIARQFDIAVSTVANHTSRIYRKLGVYRREDLVELLGPGPGPGGSREG
jgi:Response regulator containing a CheY-like receiver domain and an HTH DNA-binding domain